jgi:glycosyltransferase involved in cell wall biosynthesis
MKIVQPLVSIICLCHNHAPFVLECLESVVNQTYENIQLIVVDDASTDGSVSKIQQFLKGKPEIPFLELKENVGNCRAFNLGLELAEGKYVVDLATDDVLFPDRIEKQVELFEQLPEDFGVIYSDAELIDSEGNKIRTYHKRDGNGVIVSEPPSGNIYKELVGLGFICTPTMMIKKAVFDELNGYDETLSYEDYDFWIRSGRNWKYMFQNEILTKKRVLPNSLGTKFYQKGRNEHLKSTLKICRKAQKLNQSNQENESLAVSVRYYLRQSVWMENFPLAKQFYALLQEIDKPKWQDKFLNRLIKKELRLNRLYGFYLRLRR